MGHEMPAQTPRGCVLVRGAEYLIRGAGIEKLLPLFQGQQAPRCLLLPVSAHSLTFFNGFHYPKDYELQGITSFPTQGHD